jgi:hypothetical protein
VGKWYIIKIGVDYEIREPMVITRLTKNNLKDAQAKNSIKKLKCKAEILLINRGR